MDYCEIESPAELRCLAKAAWRLTVPEGPAPVRHRATPDGCIEIIRRLEGRSRWGSEQPESFVAGLITEPAELELSPGSRFVALRLWPWAWNEIAATQSPALLDCWADLRVSAPGFSMAPEVELAFASLAQVHLDPEIEALAAHILESRSVEELARRSGRSRRWLQRWFERNIGVPPRLYLRLLRFQEALGGMQTNGESLADHAAAHGFADQAHMTREFRAIGGSSAGSARRRAKGPFLQ